jgi:hypothetical protein
MNKFNTPDLEGYGFDLAADRVVRFNKYPDGTYLNTRATYSINKKQFTHFYLRSQAIQEQQEQPIVNEKKLYKSNYPNWVIVAGLILVLVSLGKCSGYITVKNPSNQWSKTFNVGNP